MVHTKKILLINPPASYRQEYNIKKFSPNIPLGLATIGAVLENDWHKVRIYDAPADGHSFTDGEIVTFGSFSNIKRVIENFEPDIVGISCIFSSRLHNTFSCAALAKGVNRKILTIVGGVHTIIDPNEVLSYPYVDIIALGEADYLIRDILRGVKLKNIDGIGYKKRGKLHINPKTKWIENLDELPWPERQLLSMKRYMNDSPTIRPSGRKTVRLIPRNSLMTSRGCPYRCNFCVAYMMWGPKWRARSPEDVMGEITEMVYELGVEQISFEDDNISQDKDRMMKICQELIDSDFNLKWNTPNGICIASLDKELLTKMKESGCYSLNLAIETGNERLLRKIGKTYKYDQLEEICKTCKELDIKMLGYFVIGVPGETKESIEESIDLAIKLGLDEINVSIATPHKGTRLYKECIDCGYIKKDGSIKYVCDDDFHQTTTLIDTPQLSKEELDKSRYYFYDEFNRRRE